MGSLTTFPITTVKGSELADLTVIDGTETVTVNDGGASKEVSLAIVLAEVVRLFGGQTIDGVKTFTSSPEVPTPTTSVQAANRGYVDGAVSALSPPEFWVGPPAAGGAVDKDNAAINAAVALAVAAPRGGVVRFGPGLYYYTGRFSLPEAGATGKQVTLRGAGAGNGTAIWVQTDGTTGEYLISGSGISSASNGSYKTVIEDLTFWGPQAFTAYSTARTPCELSGLMLDTHMTVNRCTFLGFKYGMNSAGNHCVVRDSKFSNGYAGVRFSAVAGLGGDILLDNVDLAGNTLASVSITNNAVATWHAVKGHYGFGPYAIYIESGAAAGTLNMYYCKFDGTSFEYLGNSLIYNPGQTSRADEVHWKHCANFSTNNATYGLPTSSFERYVYLQGFTNFSFEGGAPAGTVTDAMFDVLESISGSIHPALAGLNAAATAVKPYIRGKALLNQGRVTLRDNEFRAIAMPPHNGGAITAKTLIEQTQFGYARPHAFAGATARLPIAGIARNASTSGGREYVVVVQESPDVEVLMTGGVDPTANQVLVPSTATPSSVEPTTDRGPMTGTTTVDLASLAAGASTTFTIAVTGAVTTDFVNVTCSGALEDGLVFTSYVSATNTVTVRVRNVSAGAIDPASRTWIANVWDAHSLKPKVGTLYLAVAGSASVRMRVRFP